MTREYKNNYEVWNPVLKEVFVMVFEFVTSTGWILWTVAHDPLQNVDKKMSEGIFPLFPIKFVNRGRVD